MSTRKRSRLPGDRGRHRGGGPRVRRPGTRSMIISIIISIISIIIISSSSSTVTIISSIMLAILSILCVYIIKISIVL